MKSPLSIIVLCAGILLIGATDAPAADETNHVNLRDFSVFKLITERNIFDPNRRGPVVYTPRVDRPAVDSFALAGTMSYSNVLLAFFDGSKSDYHQALKTSEQIAGFAVSDISYDAVKLVSGTNHVDLKVGMEMRRSTDGKWSVSEASGSYGASSASGSRRRDRRESGSGRSNYSRSGSRSSSRTSGEQAASPDTNAPPEITAGGPQDMPPDMPPAGEMEVAPPAPPETAAAADDDPVARMMRRRQQEAGTQEDN